MVKQLKNYNYEFILKIKAFNTANYAYVMEKLREIMDDDGYIHGNCKLEIIPKED